MENTDPELELLKAGPTKIDLARQAITAFLEPVREIPDPLNNNLSVLVNNQIEYDLGAKIRAAKHSLRETRPDPSLPEVGRRRLTLVKEINRLRQLADMHSTQISLARRNDDYKFAENSMHPLVDALEEAWKEDIPQETQRYEQMASDLGEIIRLYKK